MFVLTLAADYEGEVVLGVYSTREFAAAASQQYLVDAERAARLYHFEQFLVYEVVVDAPAVYRF
jgi:hypothetical protein